MAPTGGRSPKTTPSLHGTPDDKTPENLATFPWVFTMTMKDGTTHLKHRDGDGDQDDGAAHTPSTAIRSRSAGSNGSPEETFSYSVDDDGTLHLVPYSPWTRATSSSGRPIHGPRSPTALGPAMRSLWRPSAARTAGRSPKTTYSPMELRATRHGNPGHLSDHVNDHDEQWNMALGLAR